MSSLQHESTGEMQTTDGRIALRCGWVGKAPFIRLTVAHDRPHKAAEVTTLPLTVGEVVELMEGFDEALNHLLKTQPTPPKETGI